MYLNVFFLCVIITRQHALAFASNPVQRWLHIDVALNQGKDRRSLVNHRHNATRDRRRRKLTRQFATVGPRYRRPIAEVGKEKFSIRPPIYPCTWRRCAAYIGYLVPQCALCINFLYVSSTENVCMSLHSLEVCRIAYHVGRRPLICWHLAPPLFVRVAACLLLWNLHLRDRCRLSRSCMIVACGASET